MIRKLLFGIGVFAVVLVTMAASGASQANAIALSTIAGIILPLVLKYVPAAGHYMVAITVGASLVVAVLAELMSGELVLNNLQGMDTSALLAAFVLVYGLSQFVYST